MKPSPKIDSFIVRIWREQAPTPQDPALVRGSIEHVQSRSKQYFQGIEALLKILQAQAQSPVRKERRKADDREKR